MRQDLDDSVDFDQFLFELSAAQRVIDLISLAYLEEDGLLLSIALLAAVMVLTVALVVVWETVLGAKWIFGLGVLTLI